jgi:hypothetical protein
MQQLQNDLKQANFKSIQMEELPNFTLYRKKSDFLRQVKGKYISTLTFFDEAEFKKRLDIFQKRLHDRFGDKEELYDPMSFTFVVCTKSL